VQGIRFLGSYVNDQFMNSTNLSAEIFGEAAATAMTRSAVARVQTGSWAALATTSSKGARKRHH
jgi:hypothetical protein